MWKCKFCLQDAGSNSFEMSDYVGKRWVETKHGNTSLT